MPCACCTPHARFTLRVLELAANTESIDTYEAAWRMLRRRADAGCDLAYCAINGYAPRGCATSPGYTLDWAVAR